MSAKGLSTKSDKRQTYADRLAEKTRQKRAAKIEKLKTQQAALQKMLPAADDSEKMLRKKLATVEQQLERLELGAYYYKRKRDDEAKERKKKKKEVRRQAKLAGIDAQLAQCETDHEEVKKAAPAKAPTPGRGWPDWTAPGKGGCASGAVRRAAEGTGQQELGNYP